MRAARHRRVGRLVRCSGPPRGVAWPRGAPRTLATGRNERLAAPKPTRGTRIPMRIKLRRFWLKSPPPPPPPPPLPPPSASWIDPHAIQFVIACLCGLVLLFTVRSNKRGRHHPRLVVEPAAPARKAFAPGATARNGVSSPFPQRQRTPIRADGVWPTVDRSGLAPLERVAFESVPDSIASCTVYVWMGIGQDASRTARWSARSPLMCARHLGAGVHACCTAAQCVGGVRRAAHAS